MASGREEQLRRMRPTLLIGLGGTGQKVLVQLKAQFTRNYGSVPKSIEFLAFDTDQNVEETSLGGQRIRLTAGTELINIGNVETAQIVNQLPRFPAMAAWMSEDKEKFPIRAVTMGAQQVRPLGRLAFFWHVGRIFTSIQAAVRRLTHIGQDVEKRGVNVFIITSVCGGTGAGIFLDTAYLVRYVISQSGVPTSSCYISGVLALPSVFPTVDPQGIESNAFAALAELDYLMDNPTWNVDYNNELVNNVTVPAQRPFNICYLIESQNERQAGLIGLEEIAPMIAEAIYLQVSDQVGNANASAFDNVHKLGQSVLNPMTQQMRPTAYSSFGTASLVFPADKIIEYAAHSLGQELIAGELLRPATDAVAVAKVLDEFIQANQVDKDTLLDSLARDAEGRVRGIVIQPTQLDNTELKDLPRAVSTVVARATKNLDDELLPMLDNNQALARTRLDLVLSREINRLVEDPAYGLYFADAFLAQMDARLGELRDKLNKELAEAAARSGTRSAGEQQTAAKAFQDSFSGGLPFNKKRKVNEARDVYLGVVQRNLRARFDTRRREVAVSALSAFGTAAQEQRKRVQATIGRLQRIETQFRAQITRLGADDRTHVLTQEITNRRDVEAYYALYKGRASTRPITGLADQYGPLGAWLDLDQETMARNLLSYSRDVFKEIQEISVEDVILEKDGTVENRRRLNDLIDRSVPFWNVDQVALGTAWEPDKIVVVGVNEEGNSIYVNAVERGQRLTSTFDKHQLLVLQTKHGLPLFALKQYEQYRTKHDLVMQRNIKPLYVLPEVRPGGHKAKQLFALGLAFGDIFRSGTFYYAHADNEVDPPIRLGQGISDALQYFRSKEEHLRSIERRIDTRVQNEGNQRALETVESWIASPYVYERKGGVNNTSQQMDKDTKIGVPTYTAADLVIDLRKVLQKYTREVLKG